MVWASLAREGARKQGQVSLCESGTVTLRRRVCKGALTSNVFFYWGCLGGEKIIIYTVLSRVLVT